MDLEGVDFLISELSKLRKILEQNDCPHTHLFTEDWGGGELTNTSLKDYDMERNQVHHMKIYGWNAEWKKKHNLA